MAKFQDILFISSIFLVLIQAGSSLKCYNCTQVTDHHCEDYFTKKVPAIECQAGFICTKHTQPAITIHNDHDQGKNLTKNIIRSCKPIDYCDNVKHFSQFCSGCSTDLCNTSYIIVPSIITICFSILISNKLKII